MERLTKDFDEKNLLVEELITSTRQRFVTILKVFIGFMNDVSAVFVYFLPDGNCSPLSLEAAVRQPPGFPAHEGATSIVTGYVSLVGRSEHQSLSEKITRL